MLFIRGGFFWGDPRLAVELKPGGHEIELAALLDVFPRTWTAEMLTVAPKREPVLTKHQLALVPTDTHDSASLAQATPQQLPQVATESSNALSQPFPQALRAIIEGSDDRASATELVAYLQGMLALPAEARVVREDSVQKPWLPSWRLWVRFVVLGVFGMMLTILIERRFRLE
jgi:hypothetical protein